MDLKSVETTSKRENTWFDEWYDTEVMDWIMGRLKEEYPAASQLWPVVEQEVLIGLWLNCPEEEEFEVAHIVAKRWLAAERKRQERAAKKFAEGDETLPAVEHSDYSMEKYLHLFTEPQARVAVAKYEQGLTEVEIAEALGVSQPAVSQMLSRMKKTLKEYLNG